VAGDLLFQMIITSKKSETRTLESPEVGVHLSRRSHRTGVKIFDTPKEFHFGSLRL
jgi:hypothetical protein